jgi:hypothetical protein
MSDGRGKSDRVEGDNHLGVIIFIRAILKGGPTVIVVDWHVAQESSVRRCKANRGTMLQDDHLSFGPCPLQKSVIRGSAGGHDVVEAATCAALVREATAVTRATWVVASAVV